MKKLIPLLVALMFVCISVFACAEQMAAGMPNPWTEVDSLEALNEAVDCNLALPAVMGITDVQYRMMDAGEYKLTQVLFKVNGVDYCLRSAPIINDISGVYLDDGNTAFAACEDDPFTLLTAENMKLARWINAEGQYVLIIDDNDALDNDTFAAIAEEIRGCTLPDTAIAEGAYEDSFSMRAYAEVAANIDGTYSILVHWSSSAEEFTQWTMTGTVAEDGLLIYNDCVKADVIISEDGTMTETPANLVPEGYFQIVDGKLLWSGAAELDCQNCVFEPTAE